MTAFKKSLELDPLMWCSYEKICKFNAKVEPSKHFSHANPKMLSFMSKINQQYQSNQPKDFALSPDNSKFVLSTENKCINANNSVQTKPVNRFNIINTNTNNSIIESENEQNKFRSIMEFSSHTNNNSNIQNQNNNLSNLSNMTPVIHKDKIENEYQNMNYNQPLMKNRDKPFVYSASPNNLGLEFQKQLNSSEIMQTNNIQNTSYDMKQKYGDSNIRPFNIFQSGLNFSETPKDNKNVFQGSIRSFNKEETVSFHSNNINQNTNFNVNPQNDNNGFKTSGFCLNNIQLNQINESMNSNNHFSKKNDSLLKNDLKTFTDVCQLLRQFAEILKAISMYHCNEAINLIRNLPVNHQKSGWTLTHLGRCYFEMAKYKESEKVFKESLKIEPARLEGLEYFSSCLWHLKDQYQLCTLANHVLEQSHFAPETWVVVGNCYSLQKEHEIAVKFFNRAIQINPYFAYAYTLSGHEYVDNESYTQAKNCYTQAIACDDR